MVFRVLEYVVAILRVQVRGWLQDHATLDGFRFKPVLPIVFYTGVRPWPHLGLLLDLFEDLTAVPELSRRLPRIEPLFINLRDTPAHRLAGEGGAFGQVLRLFQARQAKQSEFTEALEQSVAALEDLAPSSGSRWQELMSYLHALVYHERGPSEHPVLHQRIEQTVRTQRRRQEVSEMKKTMADVLREEGALRGRIEQSREDLRDILTEKFGALPDNIAQVIETCESLPKLRQWVRATMSARTLKGVGIVPPG